MLSMLLGIAIGVAIGWTIPQPTWASRLWGDVKKDITGG